jgi:hypothetical protein
MPSLIEIAHRPVPKVLPKRCPFRRKAPKKVNTWKVPVELVQMIRHYHKLMNKLDKVSNPLSKKHYQYLEVREEFSVCQSAIMNHLRIRYRRRGTRFEIYRCWKYSVC